MRTRNLNAPITKKDLIEFASRVISGIEEYQKNRIKRERREFNDFKTKLLPA